jgi:hypothetical protein
VISGNGAGIYVTDSETSNNSIQGNLIGLNSAGTAFVQNFRGILFFQSVGKGPSFNVIGGTAPGARNVISGSETNGIDFTGFVSNNRIEGNWIGTTADGTGAARNLWGGIMLFGGPQQNVIGGTTPGAGNVISGNGVAIDMRGFTTSGNRVEGNRIGTNPLGSTAIPNGGGLYVTSLASGNVIGGVNASARNVISGNLGSAVTIDGGASDNVVLGNFIGTDAVGTARLGNCQDITSPNHSVVIVGAPRNRVEGNSIAYNGNQWVGGGGVLVGDGNTTGDAAGNALLANSIHDNYGLGIDLYEPGVPFRVTPNDDSDGDLGPNDLQNFPVVDAVLTHVGGTSVNGTLNSRPNAPYTIQFFASPRCDESRHGEGETFLGSGVANTDGSGNATFSVLVATAPAGYRITATATDAAGNTSEFSQCFPQAIGFHTVAPCRVADTRDASGPWGGPALMANAVRNFVIARRCGIPETAQAVAFNFTTTGPTQAGHLTIFPVGSKLPLASTLNFGAGQTRANNAIVPLGTDGEIAVSCAQPFGGGAHFIIDVTGYFD